MLAVIIVKVTFVRQERIEGHIHHEGCLAGSKGVKIQCTEIRSEVLRSYQGSYKCVKEYAKIQLN